MTPDASREPAPTAEDQSETIWCDNCGEPNATNYISELTSPVSSANAGESAVLCDDCAAAGIGSS